MQHADIHGRLAKTLAAAIATVLVGAGTGVAIASDPTGPTTIRSQPEHREPLRKVWKEDGQWWCNTSISCGTLAYTNCSHVKDLTEHGGGLKSCPARD